MKKMGKMLCASSRKEKLLLYFSYILNFFLIATIIMIVYALRMGTRELSGSDADQADMISSAMILVVLIIIVFFLWLIAMELKGLYDSRARFNRNVRLMGFPNRKLTVLYLMELLYMQPVSIGAGLALGEIVYHAYALRTGESLLWIRPQVIAGALALHLGMLLATVFLIGAKQGKRSVISELRGSGKQKKKRLPGLVIQGAVALGVFLTVHFCCVGFQSMLDPVNGLIACQAIKLLYYVVIIFAFDPAMCLAFKIAEGIGKLTGAYHFQLALKLQESFWGRFKIMCFLFLFSGSLFCGLYSLYASARLAGGSLAEQNIHYQSYVFSEKLLERTDSQAADTAFQTLRYRALDGDGNRIWVTGIDGAYLRSFETLFEVPLTEEGYDSQADVLDPENLADDSYLVKALDDADFDGIILPEDFGGLREGDILTLDFDGTDVSFRAYTGSLGNDWGRADAYVSLAYLEKQLGLEDCCNLTFYLENAGAPKQEEGALIQTKEEICRESYTQAVKSTENIELVVWMILICSIMAVGTCLVMSCSDNRALLACLQGMGTGRRALVKIFAIQAVWNILWVVLPVIGMTTVFTKALAYATLNPSNYAISGFDISPVRFGLLFAVWFAIYMAVQLFLIGKETKQGRCVELLRK